MYSRRPGGWLVLGLVVGVLTGPAASGQEKYRLRSGSAAGDTCVVDSSVDMSLHVTLSSRDRELRPLSFVMREREGFRQEILTVDRQGVSGVRRRYSIARKLFTDASLQEKKTVSPLQGRTVTIQRKGGKLVVTGLPAKVPAKERQALAKALHDSNFAHFPEQEVAVGEEWPVDSERVMALFPGMEKAEIKYTFQEVVEHAGHPCARIRLAISMEGQGQEFGTPTTIQLTGDLYHALDLKRALSLELSGPMAIKGAQQAQGVEINAEGEGTLRIKESRRWLQVDGKPVAAKRSPTVAR